MLGATQRSIQRDIPTLFSPTMGFKLESLHLYRKVPKDLTDATSTGGLISLVCAVLMAPPALSQRAAKRPGCSCHTARLPGCQAAGCQAARLTRPATLPD